jgi:hypothetical protein
VLIKTNFHDFTKLAFIIFMHMNKKDEFCIPIRCGSDGGRGDGAMPGTVFGGIAAWLTTLFFFGAFSTRVRVHCTTGSGAGATAAGHAAVGVAAATR